MFMFPEPPPLDYRLTDVQPVFLTDGVFCTGKPTATHKFVAKQLTPIKRKVSDPLAPVQELDSRTLNRILEREREMYVACVGKDDGIVFQTLSTMPKWKAEYQGAQKSSYSVFPRSQQFELRNIRDRRIKDFTRRRLNVVECAKKEETPVSDDEPSGRVRPPVSWTAEPGEPGKQGLKDLDRDIKNPKDASTKNASECVDTFKLVSKLDETSSNGPPVDECVQYTEKHQSAFTCCHLKGRVVVDPDTAIYDNDKRWQRPAEDMKFPQSDIQLEGELRYLTKPFLHNLHTWYTINKPTKLIIPIRQTGKTPILERRFSHL